jgi:hypothetical protein
MTILSRTIILERRTLKFIPRAVLLTVAKGLNARAATIDFKPDLEGRLDRINSLFEQSTGDLNTGFSREMQEILEADPELKFKFFLDYFESEGNKTSPGIWMENAAANSIYELAKDCRTLLKGDENDEDSRWRKR